MGTPQDVSVGISVAESVFGTPVTTTRWYEILSETLDISKVVKQGGGLRAGGRYPRSARRYNVAQSNVGDVTMEVASKGMGLWWNMLLGANTYTLVGGTTWQGVFTDGDTPPSHTVQKGLPQAGGSVDAYTFDGMMPASWELDFPNQDLLTLKTTFLGQDLSTAIGYAAPSYASAPSLFTFAGGTVSNGALTAPTTTVLGSAASVVADIRGGSVMVDRNLSQRFNMNGTGRISKPTVGLHAGTFKLDAEYDSTAFRDAYINETPMVLVLNWQAGSLSTGFETLQVILSECKFDGEMPKSNGTDLIVPSLSGTFLDNLTNPPIIVVTRSSDSAL